MIYPPYTPERIASLRYVVSFDGYPEPSDVALSHASELVWKCERAGLTPNELGANAMGGVDAYYDALKSDVYLLNSGTIVVVRRGMESRKVPTPAAAVVALRAAQRFQRRAQRG